MELSADPLGVPLQLWRIHRAQPVGAQVEVVLNRMWAPTMLVDVVEGAGFALTDAAPGPAGWRLSLRRERTLADTVGPDMRLLCVGLNPSLYAADAGVGFARPGNRFWPAMLAAGLVTVAHDPPGALADHGIGMTDLVKRATARAAELAVDEYDAGLGRVDRLASWLTPAVVCVIGLDGWRKVVDRRAGPGWHTRGVGGQPVYVMPNPSGLNAHVRVADLAGHLRTAAAGPD